MPRYSVHDEILLRVHLEALQQHRKHIDSEIITLQNRLLTLNRNKRRPVLLDPATEKAFLETLKATPIPARRRKIHIPRNDAAT